MVLTANQYTDNSINQKQKSLNNIDEEILQLEQDLNLNIDSQEDAKEQIKKITSNLEKERKKLLIDRAKKEKQEKLLQQSNFILDSLNNNLSEVIINTNKVETIIGKLEKNNDEINNEMLIIADSINYLNETLSNTQTKLSQIKMLTKKILKEKIAISRPTEMEFLLESNTWNSFILNSTLYTLLIDNQEIQFEALQKKYKMIKLNYIQDSIKKRDLLKQSGTLNTKLDNYNVQLNNFNAYKKSLDALIKDKQLFLNEIIAEYENIGLQLNNSKTQITALEQNLSNVKNKKTKSLNEQKEIEAQIKLKKDSREKIRQQILKLVKTSKKLDGTPIKKLKGKLPWPINGKIITKFGKYRNPNTKVIIDYDVIELQPIMSELENITYLAKQINPNNANKTKVKQFQKAAMNMKNGDRGFGVFGPKTTQTWKKYNNIKHTESVEPIYAIHNGIIESIKFINPIVGVVIIINHGEEYFSVYNGNIEISMMENDFVKSGMQIGSIKKQNILSFQIWENKKPINPEEWLQKK